MTAGGPCGIGRVGRRTAAIASPAGFDRHPRYRVPGSHWVEREKTELLFANKVPDWSAIRSIIGRCRSRVTQRPEVSETFARTGRPSSAHAVTWQAG
jgi:hypothetical protein